MPDRITRRDFLQDAAATTAVVAVAAAPTSTTAAPASAEFASRWDKSLDRVWLGAEYWANPLQDWCISAGRIECINAAPNRNVHLLTRQLGDQPGDIAMSVRIGRIGSPRVDGGKGSAGF